jgi:hypothetical protein
VSKDFMDTLDFGHWCARLSYLSAALSLRLSLLRDYCPHDKSNHAHWRVSHWCPDGHWRGVSRAVRGRRQPTQPANAAWRPSRSALHSAIGPCFVAPFFLDGAPRERRALSRRSAPPPGTRPPQAGQKIVIRRVRSSVLLPSGTSDNPVFCLASDG